MPDRTTRRGGDRSDPEGHGWDREAAHFDDAADHGLRDPLTRAAWGTLLLEHLPEPPATVADLGCGTGSLSVLLAEAGFSVHGLDSYRAMLSRARTKAGEAGVTVELTEADVTTPPLAPADVDVVLCRHVLWALPDPAAVLERWIRLLAPDGRLILIEGRWGTGAGLAADECVALLQQAGRRPVVHQLADPVLWGRTITDERYLIHA